MDLLWLSTRNPFTHFPAPLARGPRPKVFWGISVRPRPRCNAFPCLPPLCTSMASPTSALPCQPSSCARVLACISGRRALANTLSLSPHMEHPQPELFAGAIALAPMVSLEKVAKRVG